MLNAMVALVAGALIIASPRHQHSAKCAYSNHGFRLVWVGAVAGLWSELMISPFFGYEFGWIELLIIASLAEASRVRSNLADGTALQQTNAADNKAAEEDESKTKMDEMGQARIGNVRTQRTRAERRKRSWKRAGHG